jgi:anaerobic selenocysteine-containing dehydrogenase
MTKKTDGLDRRGFLKAASLGAGAAAATVPAATPAKAAETGSERTKARYRETDHVKAYYRTNRY